MQYSSEIHEHISILFAKKKLLSMCFFKSTWWKFVGNVPIVQKVHPNVRNARFARSVLGKRANRAHIGISKFCNITIICNISRIFTYLRKFCTDKTMATTHFYLNVETVHETCTSCKTCKRCTQTCATHVQHVFLFTKKLCKFRP